MTTSISFTIEQVANHLAELMQLRKNDFISLDELRGARFAIETLVGTDNYKKVIEIAKAKLNANN